MRRGEGIAFLSPLKYHHRAFIPRFSYRLDQDERDMIKNNQGVSKARIWQMLEKKRF